MKTISLTLLALAAVTFGGCIFVPVSTTRVVHFPCKAEPREVDIEYHLIRMNREEKANPAKPPTQD
jgi:hypothetical protein